MADSAGRGLPRYVIVIAVMIVASVVGAIGVLTSGSETVAPCRPPEILASGPGLVQQFEVAEGRRAPDFALHDARDPGALVQLGTFCGQPVVLLWAVEDCPACEDAFMALSASDRPEDLEIIVIGPPADAEALSAMVAALLPEARLVIDEDDEVSRHYHLRQVPFAVTMNEDHRIDRILGAPAVFVAELPGAVAALNGEAGP